MAYYADHAQELRRDLAREIPTEELRVLHQKRPLLHAMVAIANVAALIGSAAAVIQFDRWYLWLPFAILAGFAVFDFTVLLHEVVHRAVVSNTADRLYRILGLAYAMPSGISASQFTKWHLDHHAGPLPDLLPRRGEGDGLLSARAAPHHRPRAAGHDRVPARHPRCDRRRRRLVHRLEALSRPDLLHLPHRVRPQPPRPALRHRPRRSGQVVDPGEGLLVLGRDLSLLQLPPRAPLLPERAVLQPPAPAAPAAAFLREARHDAAQLRLARVAVPRPQPEASHEVGRPAGRRAGGGDGVGHLLLTNRRSGIAL